MYEGRYAYCSVIVDKKFSSTISKSVFPNVYLFLSVFFQSVFIQSVFCEMYPTCVSSKLCEFIFGWPCIRIKDRGLSPSPVDMGRCFQTSKFSCPKLFSIVNLPVSHLLTSWNLIVDWLLLSLVEIGTWIVSEKLLICETILPLPLRTALLHHR